MFRLTVLLALVAIAAALPTLPNEDTRIDIHGSWRVVGGENAANGQFPYIVSLRSSSNSHFCGGSIINSRWILTAAHCLDGRSTANTLVVVGTNTLNAGGTTYNSARLIIHANYNANTIQNDVALINVAQDITFTSVVGTVGHNTESVGSETAVLSGWGRTVTGGPLPNQLQFLITQTITHASCQSFWGSQVSTNQICALTRSGEGACNGDSGGPLTLQSNGLQIGIVSWGRACAQGYPDVYTRVSSYTTWVNNNISS